MVEHSIIRQGRVDRLAVPYDDSIGLPARKEFAEALAVKQGKVSTTSGFEHADLLQAHNSKRRPGDGRGQA